MEFVITDLHRKTIGLLRRSERWSEAGRMNGLVNVTGMVRGKLTHEYLDEQALKELLAAGLVECDKSQRLQDKTVLEGHPHLRPYGGYPKIAETDVRYWSLTQRGRDAA